MKLYPVLLARGDLIKQMSYLVIARKYRPQSFDEIAGQEHVTQTLKSAIAQGKVAHAYLFSGPRGVGKTSAARILAKSLNCEKEISAAPCQKCVNCREVTQGSSLDVLEIDGASNRGIDEIRALRENVKFAPARSRFKIYIIDEVHSLTPDAFNALLKTLEEPPAHVKFIFATTEAHRVLPTILSRCQRFDFRRIPAPLLIKKLSEVARAESIHIDAESLNEIALASDGSLRDAQTILDQLSAYMGKKIQRETIRQVLGIIEQEILEEFISAISGRDPVKLLTLIKQLEDRGADLGQIANHLIQYCRNLLICQVGVKNLQEVLDLPEESIKRVRLQAEKLSKDEILLMLHTLVDLQQQMKRSLFPKILLELALIRMTEMSEWVKIPDLVNQLKELEGRMEVGGQSPNVSDSLRQGDCPPTREVAIPTSSQTSPNPESPRQEETAGASLEQISRSWPDIVKKIKAKKFPLGSALETAKPAALEGKCLKISFPGSENFHKEISERANNRKLVEQELEAVLGAVLTVEMTIEKSHPGSVPPDRDRQQPSNQLDDPLVKSALEIFGGRVIGIQQTREADHNHE